MPTGAGGPIAMQVRDVGSGAARRQAREQLREAVRRREIDAVLVWRLESLGPVSDRPAGDNCRNWSILESASYR